MSNNSSTGYMPQLLLVSADSILHIFVCFPQIPEAKQAQINFASWRILRMFLLQKLETL